MANKNVMNKMTLRSLERNLEGLLIGAREESLPSPLDEKQIDSIKETLEIVCGSIEFIELHEEEGSL